MNASTRPAHAQHALHHDPSAAGNALAEQERADRAAAALREERRAMLFSAGRFVIAAIFIGRSVAKIFTYDATLKALLANSVWDAEVLLPAAIAIELAGGLMLAIGYKTRPVAVALMGYVVLITALMHGNLSLELNRAFAVANLAFVGGLMMVAALGGGVLSVDGARERREARQFGLAS